MLNKKCVKSERNKREFPPKLKKIIFSKELICLIHKIMDLEKIIERKKKTQGKVCYSQKRNQVNA